MNRSLFLSLVLLAGFALPCAARSAPVTVPPGGDSGFLAPASSWEREREGASSGSRDRMLDRELANTLARFGFTGRIEATLEPRLGRPVDRTLAELGRLLWFDKVTGLADDNSCGGCHSPTNGFGDTQSIAIGIDNNNLVGPDRAGPRNQRRTPTAINTAFYRNLMWNSRFTSRSNDPFDNSRGFAFPPPEGSSLSNVSHLLVAQAFIPPAERNEVAGFEFPGDSYAIRAEVLRRLNAEPAYRRLFGQSFPEVRAGGPITFEHFGQAIAEFEFTLVFANAPLDRFARGERGAMSGPMKRGAQLFFGKAGCVGCHAVSGDSNEMFSDFSLHVVGVPQVAPVRTNSVFDGPGGNEDFGFEQVSGNPADRYRFRTSPLRNAAVQAAFFHNGAYTDLNSAIRFHVDALSQARRFRTGHLDHDLRGPVGPIEPVLARIDPLLARDLSLSKDELRDLVTFVGEGLLDPRALARNLRAMVPAGVPSGRSTMQFQFGRGGGDDRSTLEPFAASGAPEAEQAPGGVFLRILSEQPARSTVVFALDLPAAVSVEGAVFDVGGRRVAALVSGAVMPAGSHRLVWDGRGADGAGAREGVYFVSVRAGASTVTRRIVVLH